VVDSAQNISRGIIPKIVANFVSAGSQGQHTHSARTKIKCMTIDPPSRHYGKPPGRAVLLIVSWISEYQKTLNHILIVGILLSIKVYLAKILI
jgi:hypothetical protein